MKPPLLVLQGLRHHLRHPLQTALTVLGIAVGIALLSGVRLALDSAERAFDDAAALLSGHATHRLHGGPAGVPEELYARLHRDPDLHETAAAVVGGIARATVDGEPRLLRVFGGDPLAAAALRAWSGAGGSGANGTADGPRSLPLAELLTVPGAFVATPATLRRLHLDRDAPLSLQIGGRPVHARCVGELPVDGARAAGLDDVLVTDLATAQEWLQRQGWLDRIDLRLDAGQLPARTTVATAVQRLAAMLPVGVRMVPAEAGRGALRRLSAAFRSNLEALSLLSLFVGAFLVHETMRVAVVARRTAFGVLRALGVSGRRLGLLVAGEAALLGALGSVLGAGLGVLAAPALRGPLVRTLNDHYATLAVHGIAIEGRTLLLGALLGTATAILATLGPAREAARVPPRAVLQNTSEPTGRRPGALLPFAALGAVAAMLLVATATHIAQAYGGVFLLLLAAVLATPWLMDRLFAAAGRLLRPAGPWLRYVVRSTAATRTRTALPVAALALALAITVGLGILVQSFRGSVVAWLDQALPADVYVTIDGAIDERPHTLLDPQLAATLGSVDGIAAVSRYRRCRLQASVDGRPAFELDVVALDASPAIAQSFALLQGDPATARAAFASGTGALLSEPLAFRLGLQPGSIVHLDTDRGIAAIEVAGVFRDYGSERGVLMVPAAWFAAHTTVPGVSSLAFEATAGTPPELLAERLRQAVASSPVPQQVSIVTQGSLRRSSLSVFDRTFAITSALRLLVLVVAFFGIWGAFAALQLERATEIAVLRTLGAGPWQVALLVFGQTTLLGLVAALWSVPIGTALGYVLALVVNRISFGWTLLSVELPAGVLVEAPVLALVAALLAGVQPALRWLRLQPAAVLREGS